MKTKFYVDNRFVSFASFDLFADVSYMRLKINDGNDSERKLPYIESLEFLKREVEGERLITIDRLKARCTEKWELKILKYISSNPTEGRPDGFWWKEPYGDSLTGDPNYKYYHLDEKIQELFENALVFKSYLPEKKYSIFLMFSKEDLIADAYSEQWTILIPMTPTEISARRRDAYEAQREMESYFTEYPPHTDEYPPDDLFPSKRNEVDDWMDNPDDYWNID